MSERQCEESGRERERESEQEEREGCCVSC